MGKTIARNKRASFDYEFLDKFEAGIILKGWEVKSIRAKNVILNKSFVSFIKNEPFLVNMYIKQYMNITCNETRDRKLLLNKSQIKKLVQALKMRRITIIPTSIKWSNRGIIKVDIALGRGKTKVDKRETIKKHDSLRQTKKYY